MGLGDDIAQHFTQDDMDANHRVGMRQGAVENYTPDLFGFWTKVQGSLPGIHSEADITFLVERGGVEGTMHFLWQLEIPGAGYSPVLRALSINAHAYK